MTKKKLGVLISILSFLLLVVIYFGINYSLGRSKFFSISLNQVLWESAKVAWQLFWGLSKMFVVAFWNLFINNWWLFLILVGLIILGILKYSYSKK